MEGEEIEGEGEGEGGRRREGGIKTWLKNVVWQGLTIYKESSVATLRVMTPNGAIFVSVATDGIQNLEHCLVDEHVLCLETGQEAY